MTKIYNTPMLQIVSIKNNDIVCSSPMLSSTEYSGGTILGADRFRDDYDAGY